VAEGTIVMVYGRWC